MNSRYSFVVVDLTTQADESKTKPLEAIGFSWLLSYADRMTAFDSKSPAGSFNSHYIIV